MDIMKSELSRRGFLGSALLTPVMIAALTGCSSSTPGGAAASKFVWQTIAQYSLQSPDPARVEYIKQVMKEFEANSSVTVDALVSPGDAAQTMVKLIQQAQSGSAPDITMVDTYLSQRFHGKLSDLTEVFKDNNLSVDDWFPAFQDGMQAEGKPVTMPFTTDVGAMYYRKDLISEAPKSWKELIEVGKDLQKQGLSVMFPAGRGISGVNYAVLTQYFAQGFEIFTDDGQLAFEDGDAREALEATLAHVKECMDAGIAPSRIASFTTTEDQNADIVGGTVGIVYHGSWLPTVYAGLTGGGDLSEQWAAAPIPSRDGQNFASLAGGWSYGAFIPESKSELLLEAGKFLVDGFTGDAGAAKWCTIGGFLPTRSAVYDHPDFVPGAFTDSFRDLLDNYGKTRPADDAFAKVNTALQVALSSVASGTESPQEAVKRAIEQSK